MEIRLAHAYINFEIKIFQHFLYILKAETEIYFYLILVITSYRLSVTINCMAYGIHTVHPIHNAI